MPAKTKHKRAASQTGRRIKKRATRQSAARRGRTESSPTAAVIADSIYTVRFKERSGPEVFCLLEDVDIRDFEKMYHDLWKAWANLKYRLTGDRINFNAGSAGISIPVCLNYVLTEFRQMIPVEFKYNIEKDEKTGDYYFMIYRYCEWYRCWHYIEVGQALVKLKKENRPLHDLFLSFLRLFNRHAADLWDIGLMGSSLDNLDDRVCQFEDEGEDDTVEKYNECISEYRNGSPSKYLPLIRNARAYKALDLKKRANRFKAGTPIANLIYQGADLFLERIEIQDYLYLPGDEEDSFYLELESQVNIIWKEDDPLFNEHCEHMDALANEGTQEPVLSFRIDASTRKVDFADLNKKSHWPNKLSKFFEIATELINSYTNERKN